MRKTITRIVMVMCIMALSLPIVAQKLPTSVSSPSSVSNTILEPMLNVGDTVIRDKIVYVVKRMTSNSKEKKTIYGAEMNYVVYKVTYEYELYASDVRLDFDIMPPGTYNPSVPGQKGTGGSKFRYTQKLSSFKLLDNIDLTHKARLSPSDFSSRPDVGTGVQNINSYDVIGHVTSIGDYAFAGFYNGLDPFNPSSYSSPFADGIEISVPSSISYLGKEAFSCNPGIKSVYLNCNNVLNNSTVSLYQLGEKAFAFCPNLETVTFNGSISSISDHCFANDRKLKNVMVNWLNLKKLNEIGNGAFTGDVQFEGFMYKSTSSFYAETTKGFPPYITSIGDDAFKGCTSMSDAVFNTSYSNSTAYGIASIGTTAFSGTSLRVCKLPNTLLSLDMSAFDNTLVKHVSVPSYVSQLTNRNTEGSSITEVTVPNGATVDDMSGDKTLYCLSTTTDGLPTVTSSGAPIYVKPSVYAKLSSNPYNRFQKDIPITMPNTCDESGHAYVSLCRDFDCDFSGSGLNAYALIGLHQISNVIDTKPLNYAPSRFNALSTRDKFERYAGIILEGEPGKTYYYHIGEQDYTTGDSRVTEGGAFAKSSDLLWGKGSVDGEYVTPTNDDGSVNYGLSRAKYRSYSEAGWVPYNRTYLNVPSSALAAKVSTLRISFGDDGNATSIKLTDLDKMLKGDATYDLQGRKVGKDYKGIVIRNGKKTLQK